MKDPRPWCRGSQSGWELVPKRASTLRREKSARMLKDQINRGYLDVRRAEASKRLFSSGTQFVTHASCTSWGSLHTPSSIGRPRSGIKRKAPAETVAMRRCQVRDETQSGESSPAVCARSCQAGSRSIEKSLSCGGRRTPIDKESTLVLQGRPFIEVVSPDSDLSRPLPLLQFPARHVANKRAHPRSEQSGLAPFRLQGQSLSACTLDCAARNRSAARTRSTHSCS